MFTLKPQMSSGDLQHKEGAAYPIAEKEKPATLVNVETAPSPNGSTNRNEDVIIGSEGQPCKYCILHLLEPFSHMCLGQKGVIKATQTRIDSVPGATLIHQQSCRAGPKARELEIQDVE